MNDIDVINLLVVAWNWKSLRSHMSTNILHPRSVFYQLINIPGGTGDGLFGHVTAIPLKLIG